MKRRMVLHLLLRGLGGQVVQEGEAVGGRHIKGARQLVIRNQLMLSADEVLLDGLRGFKTGGGEVRHVGVAVDMPMENTRLYFSLLMSSNRRQQSATSIPRPPPCQPDRRTWSARQLAELPREVIPEALPQRWRRASAGGWRYPD